MSEQPRSPDLLRSLQALADAYRILFGLLLGSPHLGPYWLAQRARTVWPGEAEPLPEPQRPEHARAA